MDQPITPEEARWRAEADARTLAEADVINNDPNRKNEALTAAKRVASEMEQRSKDVEKEADAMNKLAGNPSNTPDKNSIDLKNSFY